jgi:hypothetical protein
MPQCAELEALKNLKIRPAAMSFASETMKKKYFDS